MLRRLTVIDGADQGRYFPLGEEGTLIIGTSHKRADIHLNDLYVSRVHCYVELADGMVVIADADDSNGTSVNGQKVKRQPLQLGDVVRVGNTHFRLEEDTGSPPIVRASTAPGASGPSTYNVSPATGSGVVAAAVSPTTTTAERPVRSAVAEAPALEDLADSVLAHYQLGKVVGKGHFGVVFRARELENDQVVAIKVLHPDFPKNDDEMQRFIQAMRLMPPLRHPNLVTVLGVGRTPPHCWIALEYVPGENLAHMIPRLAAGGKHDWQPGFRLAVHIGRALHFAHQHQLCHRNITPQNILFRSTDNLFKLGDLIQHRAFHGSGLRLRTLKTKSHSELAYLTPEQTQPQPSVDARTDIFALGTAIYALLAGRPPFAGKTPPETISQIREAEPPSLKQWQPALPEKFESIIHKMLAKRPEDRHQTAKELLTDLMQVALDPG
jgi:serine/threonine-protein kinase